ncbi:MAG: hypothetical protein JXK94_14065 [Deltaproteobacteria bacterium]|nr:hypothetical protein [Deltaproteobacteria bacterium]
MKNTVSQKPNGIWLLSLCAGIVFLNFPFIQVFNGGGDFFGVPTLVAYIFLAWSLLLLGLIVFSHILCPNSDQDDNAEERRKDQ